MKQDGIPLTELARRTGISLDTLQRWARSGRLIGARMHPLCRKWWVYPPAKLVLGDGSPHPMQHVVSANAGSVPGWTFGALRRSCA